MNKYNLKHLQSEKSSIFANRRKGFEKNVKVQSSKTGNIGV